MIKAVLFDLAGVVVSEGFEIWQQKNISDRASIADALLTIGPQIDRGTMPVDAYVKLFATITHMSPEEVNKGILAEYEIHSDILALLNSLHAKGIKTGIITNFPEEWFDYLVNKFHLTTYFDAFVVSSKIHIVKPEAGLYQASLAQLDIHPEEAIFVDDREENVLGAKDSGMHGLLFTTSTQLQKDLEKIGLSV